MRPRTAFLLTTFCVLRALCVEDLCTWVSFARIGDSRNTESYASAGIVFRVKRETILMRS